MNRLRFFIRSFFGFSKTETNAFVLLVPLVLLILFSGPMYRQLTFDDRDPFLNISRTDSLLAAMERVAAIHELAARVDTVPLHQFDPNTISEQEFIGLQLKKAVASRIVRYREKGGYFYKKEDLLKIFGMDTVWFRRASKYITIQSQRPERERKKPVVKALAQSVGDLNTADSLQLLRIFGIGPVLAKRIMVFRDRLGGFVSMDQLREVYGLDSGVVKNMKRRFEVMDGFQPRVIMLNEVNLDGLIAHPYIKRREAQAILAYRLQHGAFDSLGQLRNIRLLDATWIDRVRPYFRVSMSEER